MPSRHIGFSRTQDKWLASCTALATFATVRLLANGPLTLAIDQPYASPEQGITLRASGIVLETGATVAFSAGSVYLGAARAETDTRPYLRLVSSRALAC